MTSITVNMFHIFRRSVRWLIFLLLVILTACTTTPPPLVSRTPTAAALTPSATPRSQPVLPTPAPDRPVTLTLWLPTHFLPAADNATYQVLQNQLTEFAGLPQGVPSQIAVKQDRGPGGLLDLLRTASPVAPAALPDIIALDQTDLETAARSGLIQPIGSLLPADLIGDLYPFARDLGSYKSELYGLIYSVDIEQLASAGTAPLPETWNDLLKAARRYLFPWGTSNTVSDAVLAHYLSAGGRVTDEQGNPVIDEVALRTLLQTYLEARDNSVLPASYGELDSADRVWGMWRGLGTAVANVNATRYLSVEARLPNLQVGPLPTLIQPARPLGRGWAYAIVATDPQRQAAAAQLLQYLLSPPNSGAWTRAAKVLPSRPTALTQWDQAKPYTAFVGDQLTHTQALPSASIRAVVGPILRKAIDDVLADRATPSEAARAAAATLNPK
jgi:ABC-type glycerol-3-phosphate transport system substrate-binding protein